jgi:hypothetical protein
MAERQGQCRREGVLQNPQKGRFTEDNKVNKEGLGNTVTGALSSRGLRVPRAFHHCHPSKTPVNPLGTHAAKGYFGT